MGVPKTSDHIQINIRMRNPSQEPPASSKAPITAPSIIVMFFVATTWMLLPMPCAGMRFRCCRCCILPVASARLPRASWQIKLASVLLVLWRLHHIEQLSGQGCNVRLNKRPSTTTPHYTCLTQRCTVLTPILFIATRNARLVPSHIMRLKRFMFILHLFMRWRHVHGFATTWGGVLVEKPWCPFVCNIILVCIVCRRVVKLDIDICAGWQSFLNVINQGCVRPLCHALGAACVSSHSYLFWSARCLPHLQRAAL